MLKSPSYIHKVDSHDIIYEVNSDWIVFAQQNRYDMAFENTVLGHSLWEFIHNDHVIQLYKEMIRFVRSQEQPITFNYRCDSETMFRMMRMWISPLPSSGHVEFRSIVESQRNYQPEGLQILNPTHSRTHEFVRMCSYCKAVKQNGEWISLHSALRTMDMLERDEYPIISHGICPECYNMVETEIDNLMESG